MPNHEMEPTFLARSRVPANAAHFKRYADRETPIGLVLVTPERLDDRHVIHARR